MSDELKYNMILTTKDYTEVSFRLNNGQIGVMPTDTIYGIHCLYKRADLVKKIYLIKDRPEIVSFICIVPTNYDLSSLGIKAGEFEIEKMKEFWPGPNTLIFTKQDGQTLALRTPDNEFLQKVLKSTGPLISTSANLHGKPVAKNISEAKTYFGEKIDFYVDAGEMNNPPSNIYLLKNASVEKIR